MHPEKRKVFLLSACPYIFDDDWGIHIHSELKSPHTEIPSTLPTVQALVFLTAMQACTARI